MPVGVVAVPIVVVLKRSSAHTKRNCIDTATKIKLISAADGALMYYTINGQPPEPFRRRGGTNTHIYRAPFTLPPGKVTLKAKAISKDANNESSTVTKTFSVEKEREVKEQQEEKEEDEDVQFEGPEVPPLSLAAQLRHRMQLNPPSLTSHKKLNNSARCSSPQRSKSVAPVSAPTSSSSSASIHYTVSHSPTLHPRPQTRCTYCHAPYSRDSSHHYCSDCGASLPALPGRLNTSPAKFCTCPSCGARVQFDVGMCPGCESIIPATPPPPIIKAQPSTTDREGESIVCLNCGSRNLASCSSCVTCDATLQQHQLSPTHLSSSPPFPPPALTTMLPISGGSYIMCGRCGRVNVSDARFCDWCGCKPQSSHLSVSCLACGEHVHWHYSYCTSCGAFIRAPHRSGVEVESTMKVPMTARLGRETWIPVVDIELEKTETRHQSTQTNTPSSSPSPAPSSLSSPTHITSRAKRGGVEASLQFPGVGVAGQASVRAGERNGRRRLSEYSPGQGLWRMQVDHVCSHLKAYSLSCPSFQEEIRSLQLGKLTDSEVNRVDSEVDIRLHFLLKKGEADSTGKAREAATAGQKTPSGMLATYSGSATGNVRSAASSGKFAVSKKWSTTNKERSAVNKKHSGASKEQSAATNGRSASTNGRSSATNGRSASTNGKSAATNGRSASTNGRSSATNGRSASTNGRSSATNGRMRSADELLPTRVQLQRRMVCEVSAGGPGREIAVEELLQKGVDVNSVDNSGVPLLSLAAANGHLNCLSVLVSSGANINAQSTRMGNTALHEAVQRGSSTMSYIQTLLDHGANASTHNRGGESACQLAQRLGHSDLVSCFTAHESRRLLHS